FRIKPEFERKACRVRSKHDKIRTLADHPDPFLQLEFDQVAEDATFVGLIKLPADPKLLGSHRRGKRYGNQLAVRMTERSPCLSPVILEQDKMSQPEIVSQIQQTCPVCKKDVRDLCRSEISHPLEMVRRLDYHFMCTDSVTHIVKTVPSALDLTLYPEGRIFVGYDSYLPTRVVRLSVVPYREDLRRGLPLEAITERADIAVRSHPLHMEIPGPSPPVRGNNDPMLFKWIPPQF